jgi:transposase InsO family protein
MKLLAGGMASGIDLSQNSTLPQCKHCLFGGQHKISTPSQASRASKVLELIHTDICGPMNHISAGGAKYFITFIDDNTRMTFVSFLKKKSEALSKFMEFKALVENQQNSTIKKLRSDNGGEYTSNEFAKYLKDCGISHETTSPYNPEQNGVSE